MLCRSVAAKGLEKIQKLINGAEMAEIRIEKSGLSKKEVEKLFGCHKNLIATCRDNGLSQTKRLGLLTAAINGGAKWVDIEVESPSNYITELARIAKAKRCNVIISYHNFNTTPNADELKKILMECNEKGADLVKIATMANNTTDVANLLGLYKLNIPVLSFGMGELGKSTRIDALKMGAPFMFVSCDNEHKTAPGQLTESEMKRFLNNL